MSEMPKLAKGGIIKSDEPYNHPPEVGEIVVSLKGFGLFEYVGNNQWEHLTKERRECE